MQNKPDNQADPEKLRRLRSDLAELKNLADGHKEFVADGAAGAPISD